MHNAYIIETGEFAAGIVTRERRGFVFHAAADAFRLLDGRLFDSLAKAQRAADTLRRDKGARGSRDHSA
ncbi:hypothetical protein CCR94_24145 [Rhodoblastus sphagnicola]|uniref:Uncharacterized protein n=1 Tax=Rhodoblastus sphagnicola TaxID=333368 RepID=A0A2S6MU15_9HYPH|nr:hypothetical protein [Rhodoblastus sphagnicola]MBB4199806.1 hypothetical protein [Rhodoblastus sphagnicola]PPQ25860.1 hypothetical protein CCR94_24145 [Rhodoblastus sphagnicola]